MTTEEQPPLDEPPGSRRSRRDPVVRVVLFIGALGFAALWCVGAGVAAAFSGAFGGIGGWAWAMTYVLVPAVLIAGGWPVRGRRVVAAVGVIVAVVLGLHIAHTTPYTVKRMQQILDHAPKPPDGVLVSATAEAGGFNSPQVYRTYRVPDGPTELADYEAELTRAGWHLTDSGSSLDPRHSYKKGRLILTIRDVDQGVGNSPPAIVGYSYITINAWTR